MGQSAFEPAGWDVELDAGCGMSFSAVHKVRAEACRRLEEAILAPYAARTAQNGNISPGCKVAKTGDPTICALVTTPECAEAALAACATRVYAPSDDLARGAWPDGVIPWLDEICREADYARLDPWVRAGEPVAVGNVSELALAAERGALPEVRSCIPVHNEAALASLAAAGAAGVWLSPELTLEEICALARTSSVPVGLSVLGRERVMTSEHCVLQALGRCHHDCAHCPERARNFSLRDIDGNLLPVRTDLNGRSRIWTARPLDATPQIPELVAAGVARLLVDAQLMDVEKTSAAVARVVRALEATHEGRRPASRAKGATSGHLFSPVG